MLICAQAGLEALHLPALLPPLLLLVGLLSSGRGLGCEPGPQDVHPQEVQSPPRSLQNTRGTNSATNSCPSAGTGRLVLLRDTKQLDQRHLRVHGNQKQWQVPKINGLVSFHG